MWIGRGLLGPGGMASIAVVLAVTAQAQEAAEAGAAGMVLRLQAKSAVDRRVEPPATFTPDGRRLAVVDKGGDLLILEASVGAGTIEVKRFGGAVFSPDGEKMLTVSLGGLHGLRKDKYQMWNLRRGHELSAFEMTQKQTDNLVCATFSPDGSVLATAHKDMSIHIWETSAGAERFSISGRQRGRLPALFSPNGKYIAVAGGDEKLKLWGINTGEVHFEVGRFRNGMFSPGGRSLLVWKNDGKMALMEVATGRTIFELKVEQQAVTSLEFSPDGSALATLSDNGVLRMWDGATGMLLFETKTGGRGELYVSLQRAGAAGWWTVRNSELVWDLASSSEEESAPKEAIEDSRQ